MNKKYEDRQLSNIASHGNYSKGRKYKDSKLQFNRTEYQRDRDRILYSDAFKRLKHKTQVFFNTKNDHVRTRLTHTLEVAQLARSVARYLNLNDDLAEAISLAHDLGHPPFGHAGEDVLHDLMKNYGGFNHNLHTLKIVTKIEKKYLNFDGLNLTYETLDGIIKHNGPFKSMSNIPKLIKSLGKDFNFEIDKYSSLEGQIANICDDIAYVSHDLEDGLRSKIIKIKDLINLPIIDIFLQKFKNNKINDDKLLIHYLTNNLANYFVNDLVENSTFNIIKNEIKTIDDVINYGKQIIKMKTNTYKELLSIKKFLFQNMYNNKEILDQYSLIDKKFRFLFDIYTNEPKKLPVKWRSSYYNKRENISDEIIAVDACDYIASMTDNYFEMKFSDLIS